ncbi:MAG: zinc ribbon domain-containing protein [Acidobacteriia bacterium]|nr:zinc ribbon domain-containing protein [Terriglobia bacterium]
MFCEGCGTELQTGSRVCGKCGRELVGYAEVKRDRLARHVQLLGIFWITYSTLHLIGGAVLIILSHTLFPHLVNMGAPEFLPLLLTCVAVFLLVKAVLGITAGWGLVQRASWARILSIVLGFLALLHVPFGTAIGVYTIWALLPPGADVEYQALSQQA